MLDGLLLQKDVKNGPKRPNNVQGREKTTSYLIFLKADQKNKTKIKQKKKQKHCKIPQNVPLNKGNISRFLPLKVQSQITYSFK